MRTYPNSRLARMLSQIGSWLHPQTPGRPGSAAEQAVHIRAGLVGLVAVTTTLLTFFLGGWLTLLRDPIESPWRGALDASALSAAIVLILASGVAPTAVFRTRSMSTVRAILDSPSRPYAPWATTTVAMNAMLVGGMLAGVFLPIGLTITIITLALVVRFAVTSSMDLRRDRNARYHALVTAWTSGAIALVAYAVVAPLSVEMDAQQMIIPLILAGFVAMAVTLMFAGVGRWVAGTHEPWAFARDAANPRRIIVAVVTATIAWLVLATTEYVSASLPQQVGATATLAGVGVFVAAWLALWFISVRLWAFESHRALELWSQHQAQILGRLADTTLDAGLAARAAPITTARMAISVFAATRAVVVLDHGLGAPTLTQASAGLFAGDPIPPERSLLDVPHLNIPMFADPSMANTTRVIVADWLLPGWFLSRDRRIVDRFQELAASALTVPELAARGMEDDRAFERMFNPQHAVPSLDAFEQALERMRVRADAHPGIHSVVVGVFAIDDFGALRGGKFEHAAVQQVLHMAAAFDGLARYEHFIAYEDPGRIWVIVSGGSLMRAGIDVLRGLQERINTSGAVPAAHVDIDVHVGVSFGYAAHQVDDFSSEGLMAVARDRLTVDAAARNPLIGSLVDPRDITPEAIIAGTTPIAPIDALALMDDDRARDPGRFERSLGSIVDVRDGATQAVCVSVRWHRTLGQAQLDDPAIFHAFITRQIELAASASLVLIDHVAQVLRDLAAHGSPEMPVLIPVPPVLLTTEAAALALPNLIVPRLSREERARTILLINTIPQGSGQALRTLADRDLNIAVTAGAAAHAAPEDLAGWQRWGVVFPPSAVENASTLELLIHQTLSAVAGPGSRVIIEGNRRTIARVGDIAHLAWETDLAAGFFEHTGHSALTRFTQDASAPSWTLPIRPL